jgi:hypothetical protein
MRRYGVSVRFTGTTYVEVDVPNGEDPDEYALADAEHRFTNICDWESEVLDVSEVDPNE